MREIMSAAGLLISTNVGKYKPYLNEIKAGI